MSAFGNLWNINFDYTVCYCKFLHAVEKPLFFLYKKTHFTCIWHFATAFFFKNTSITLNLISDPNDSKHCIVHYFLLALHSVPVLSLAQLEVQGTMFRMAGEKDNADVSLLSANSCCILKRSLRQGFRWCREMLQGFNESVKVWYRMTHTATPELQQPEVLSGHVRHRIAWNKELAASQQKWRMSERSDCCINTTARIDECRSASGNQILSDGALISRHFITWSHHPENNQIKFAPKIKFLSSFTFFNVVQNLYMKF